MIIRNSSAHDVSPNDMQEKAKQFWPKKGGCLEHWFLTILSLAIIIHDEFDNIWTMVGWRRIIYIYWEFSYYLLSLTSTYINPPDFFGSDLGHMMHREYPTSAYYSKRTLIYPIITGHL